MRKGGCDVIGSLSRPSICLAAGGGGKSKEDVENRLLEGRNATKLGSDLTVGVYGGSDDRIEATGDEA
jgi:hypothetical protein